MLDALNSSIGSADMSVGLRGAPNPRIERLDHLWSIILAGGRGERIGSFVRRWVGRAIPKQYCAFVGTRSMLQHTLDRAIPLGRRDHQLLLIARSHLAEAELQIANRLPDTVILQPENRDTIPGIYLPLTYIFARDSDATVIVYPSDHFIYPESDFTAWIAGAIDIASELPDYVSLVGASADRAEPDYGWISVGDELKRKGRYSLRSIRHFSEKPTRARAMTHFSCGWLWNTMIVVAKARTLWQLGWQYFPEIMVLFAELKHSLGTSRESSVLESIYESMPTGNFSADLLARANGKVAVIPMQGILWSDWGRAERIAETLRGIGKQPNFPETILAV